MSDAAHDAPRADVNRPTDVRVYVNERGVSVPTGSSALDAVRALFPEEAQEIENGRARLADSRGLPTDERQPAIAGAIFRVVAVRDRATEVA
jgi:hypothetical protein